MLVKSKALQKLQIKPLPATGLNSSYALLMGNGMIKHYTVSVQTMLTSPEKPEDLIMQDIRNETGFPDLEFEMLPADGLTPISESTQELAQQTFLLLLDPEVRQAMTGYSGQSQLRQFKKKYKNSGKYSFFAPLIENKLTNFVITKLRKFCLIPLPEDFGVFEVEGATIDVSFEILKDPYKSRFHKLLFNGIYAVYQYLSYFVTEQTFRHVAPAWYFAVTFEEKDLDRAIQALADDVNILGKALDIKGSFSTGKLVSLSNTVGNSGKVFAFLVSPYVDATDRLPSEIWMSPDKTEQCIKDLGIKYYSREGDSVYLNGKAPYSSLVIGQSKHLGRPVMFMDDSDPMSEGLDVESQQEAEALAISTQSTKKDGDEN